VRRAGGRRTGWLLRRALARAGLTSAATRLRLAVGYWARRPHDPDFRLFARLDGEPGLFIDGGANSGQSALSFRLFNATFRILSFEANPLLERDLAWTGRLLGASFAYRMVGLGSATTERVLHVPVVDGVPITGEATFDERLLRDEPGTRARIAAFAATDALDVLRVPSRVVKLDDLELAPQAIKLDVQGEELDAIRGMLATIARSRPVIMLENNLRIAEIRDVLREHGYRDFVYDPATNLLAEAPTPPETVNVFFLTERHHERLAGGAWRTST
jgi:FkbM family methyltransferase